jgi:hypothetical protein
VADIEDALEFLVKRRGVVELRVLPRQRMARGRLETALGAALDLSVRQGSLPIEITAGSVNRARRVSIDLYGDTRGYKLSNAF